MKFTYQEECLIRASTRVSCGCCLDEELLKAIERILLGTDKPEDWALVEERGKPDA